MFAGFLISILGDFNVEEFYASSNYGITPFLFVLFMILVSIVMLNLLVASTSDIFDKVQENAEAEFLFARAQLILEVEGRLSSSQNKNKE